MFYCKYFIYKNYYLIIIIIIYYYKTLFFLIFFFYLAWHRCWSPLFDPFRTDHFAPFQQNFCPKLRFPQNSFGILQLPNKAEEYHRKRIRQIFGRRYWPRNGQKDEWRVEAGKKWENGGNKCNNKLEFIHPKVDSKCAILEMNAEEFEVMEVEAEKRENVYKVQQ